MFITRKITGKGILIIAVTFLVGCSHYGLLDKLENPGGPNAGGGLQSPRRIFVTSNPSKGNLGGISGADANCLTDSNNPLGPGNGNWKAMVVDGSARRACTNPGCSGGLSEQIDWVLKPNTTYARPDGTIIATTNPVGLFTFPLENAIAPLPSVYAWTGLDSSWQTTTTHCAGWTNNNSNTGTWAKVGDVTSQAIYASTAPCLNTHRLYCVEQ
jgi:hypothetical protein